MKGIMKQRYTSDIVGEGVEEVEMGEEVTVEDDVQEVNEESRPRNDDKESEDQAETLMENLPLEVVINETAESDTLSTKMNAEVEQIDVEKKTEQVEVKKNPIAIVERVKCTKCNSKVPKRSYHLHLKLKHKENIPPGKLNPSSEKTGEVICKFCESKMTKKSLVRHLRNKHQSTLDEHESAKNLNVVKDQTANIDKPVKDEIAKAKEKLARAKQNLSSFRRCKLCSKIIKNDSYQRHLKDVHERTNFKCSLCRVEFARKVTLIHHIDTKHRNLKHLLDDQLNPTFEQTECKFECGECAEKFISADVIVPHKERMHGVGKFQCENCKRKYSESRHLKRHMLICK